MFIHSQRGGYDRHGGQWSSGAFLMLCLGDAWKPWTGGNLRAMVRHVKLRQLGHFMAGHAIIPTMYHEGSVLFPDGSASTNMEGPKPARAKLHLIGAFGSDGLPMHVPTKVTLDKGLREQPVNLDWRCLKLDNGQPYYTPKEHTAESPCWYSRGVPWQVYERMAPVPDEIAMAVGNDDTGHNSAGVQAIGKLGPWARGNLRALQRAGGPRSPWPKPVMHTYEVFSLDVWGNALNGYDINDWHRVGTVEIPSDVTDDAGILRILRKADYLNDHVTARCFEVEDPSCDGHNLTIVDNRQPRLKKRDETAVTHGHGRPILELRRVERD